MNVKEEQKPKPKSVASKRNSPKKKEHGHMRWLSVEEAQQCSVGQERWWELSDSQGRKVALHQYVKRAPKDRPICRFNVTGNMYLGQWEKGGPANCLEPHGFGIYYWHSATKRGLVCIGNISFGLIHGRGEQFWLESSKVWKQNYLLGSWTEQEIAGKTRGVPNRYIGNFRNDRRHDERAVVVLKDGTCRIGPWRNDEVVGEWEKHDRAASLPQYSTTTDTAAATAAAAAATATPRTSNTKSQATKRKKPDGRPKEAQLADSSGKGNVDGTVSDDDSKRKKEAESEVPVNDQLRNVYAEFLDAVGLEKVAAADRVANLQDNRREAGAEVRAADIKEEDTGVPFVIEICEDSDQETSGNVPKKENVSSDSTIHSTNQDAQRNQSLVYQTRIRELQEWISNDVVGNNPDPERVETYARKLHLLGFDSVELAMAYLDESWIKDFDWMAPLHRELFLAKFKK